MSTDQTTGTEQRAARKPRPPRLTEEEREALRAALAKEYRKDPAASVRSLAAKHGRSFGLVYGLLREAGVEFRSRTRRAQMKNEAK